MLRRISFSAGFALAASLIATALLSSAQAQKPQIERLPLVNAPNVQITEVKNPVIQGDDATLVIEVSWTATAPQGTQVKGFQMLIEVQYADGSKDKTTPAAATPGQTRLRVLNKGSNLPKRFTITVVSEFTAPSSTPLSVIEEFDLGKANNFDSHGNSAPQSRGQFLSITEVKKQLLGCSSSQDCFDVFWVVSSNVPGIAGVNKFNVEAEVTYKFGQTTGATRNASDNVDGSKRQAQLVIQDAVKGTADLSIHVKATIKAFITVATTSTTVKDGSF